MLHNPTLAILTFVFVVLKLLGVLHWAWLWILSPIWIGALLYLLLVLAAAQGKWAEGYSPFRSDKRDDTP